MKYFPLLYRLHAEDRYLLWISNEKDSVAVDDTGFVLNFRDLAGLRKYADLNHHSLETAESVPHDLEWVAHWILAPETPVDCKKALTAWNLFGDVAASIPSKGVAFKEIASQLPSIYDKLFWGNNIPAVTPKGKRYDPEWSADEIRSLKVVLTAGLDLFASAISTWPGKDQ